jgi:hypothetical protein
MYIIMTNQPKNDHRTNSLNIDHTMFLLCWQDLKYCEDP